jgi:hypothetical protein
MRHHRCSHKPDKSSSASCCPLSWVAYVPDEVKRMTNDVQAPVFSALGVKNFAVATPLMAAERNAGI